AKPSPVRIPTASRFASSRFRALNLLRHDLCLVALDGRERRAVAPEVVAEEAAALGLGELPREHRALVAEPVEPDAAGDVPREALVDGDPSVLLGADEVRARQRPDDERSEDDDERARADEDCGARDAPWVGVAPASVARCDRLQLVAADDPGVVDRRHALDLR